MIDVLWSGWEIFMVITLVYALVEIVFGMRAKTVIAAMKEQRTASPSGALNAIIYATVVIVAEIGNAVYAMSTKCQGGGGLSTVKAVGEAMIWWFLVFGVIVGLLSSPKTGQAWRSPFSGGVLYTLIRSVKNNIKSVTHVKPDEDIYKVASKLDISNYIENVHDPKFMSGTLTPAGRTALSAPSKLDGVNAPWEDIVHSIAKRDMIANIIWYVMAGTLATMMYATTLASAKCRMSGKQMKKIYEQSVKDQHAADKEATDQQVYKVRD
jgi:hypothetical protein